MGKLATNGALKRLLCCVLSALLVFALVPDYRAFAEESDTGVENVEATDVTLVDDDRGDADTTSMSDEEDSGGIEEVTTPDAADHNALDEVSEDVTLVEDEDDASSDFQDAGVDGNAIHEVDEEESEDAEVVSEREDAPADDTEEQGTEEAPAQDLKDDTPSAVVVSDEEQSAQEVEEKDPEPATRRNARAKAASSTKPFLVRASGMEDKEFDTWAATFTAINSTYKSSYQDTATEIVVQADYTMTLSDMDKVFTLFRWNGNGQRGALTITGNGHTIKRTSGVKGNLFNFNQSNANTVVTINNLTIEGNSANSGALLVKQNAYSLACNNVVLDGKGDTGALFAMTGGGKVVFTGGRITNSVASTGMLVDRTANGGSLTFSGTNILRGRTTGTLVHNKTATGWIAFRNMTIDGTHEDGTACASCLVQQESTGALYFGNNQDTTVDEGVAIVGGTTTGNLIERSGAGLMVFTKGSITGPSVDSSASLVYDNANGNGITFTDVSIARGMTTGTLIEKTKTQANSTITLTGSTVDGTSSSSAQNGSLVKLTSTYASAGIKVLEDSKLIGGVTTADLVSATGLYNSPITIENSTITGSVVDSTGSLVSNAGYGAITVTSVELTGGSGAMSGALINNTGTGAVTITSSTLTGPSVASSGTLVNSTGSGNMAISSSTILRGPEEGVGAAGEGIVCGTGTLTISDSTIDGKSVPNAASLIKKTSGAQAVTITGTTVKGHTGAANTYAVDIVTSHTVKVDGETSIHDNTAAGSPANLNIVGTYTYITFTSTLNHDIGISTTQSESGNNFSVMSDASVGGLEHLINDAHPDTTHAYNPSGVILRWRANDYLSAMFGMPDVTIQDLKTYPTQEDLELLPEGATAGEKNEDKLNPYMLWKSATYNADTNSVDLTLNFFQKQTALDLDFIFVIDETGTMTDNKTANGVTQSQALWARYAALKASQEMLALNGKYKEYGANNRVCFISWGGTTVKASEFFTDFDEATEFVESYAAIAGGTDHSVGINAATEKAKQSRAAGQRPIVVYLSDYQAHFRVDTGATYIAQSEMDALHEQAESIYAFLVYETYSDTIKARMKALTDYEYHYYMSDTKDPSTLITPFVTIVRDALYKCGVTNSIDDVLANGVLEGAEANGVTSADAVTGTVTNAATFASRTDTATWQLLNDAEEDNRLLTGTMYGKTITIPLTDNVWSGSMPTNGTCALKVGGTEVNTVDSPILSHDVRIKVREQKLEGEDNKFLLDTKFTVEDYNGKKLELEADEDGVLTIPYDKSDDFDGTFPLKEGATYELRQTATQNADYVVPTGRWTLTVDKDTGQIIAEVKSKDTDMYKTLPILYRGGVLVVENEKPVFKIVLSSGTDAGTTTFKDLPSAFAFAKAHKESGQQDITIQLLSTEHVMDGPGPALAEKGAGTTITLTTASASDSSYPYRGEDGTAGVVKRGYNGASLMQLKNGSLIVENIVFDGDKANHQSVGTNNVGYGGILNMQGGTAIMKRGAVFRNSSAGTDADGKAADGGAVFVKKGATLEMRDDASIQGCESAARGGGVSLGDSATLKMYESASIAECSSTKQGAGVFATGKAFVGLLTDEEGNACKASISNNRTDERGGGIFCAGGVQSGQNYTLHIEGGSITGNSSGKNGGGIYLTDDSGEVRVSLSGDVTIADNTTQSSGGGIYINRSKSNTVQVFAGDKVVVSGNTAMASGGQGGGVFINGGALSLTGTSVKQNKAASAGAGIYTSTGTVTLSGASVEGNVVGASGNGGGVYVGASGVLNVQGAATVTDNTKGEGESAIAQNVYLPGDNAGLATGTLQVTANLSGTIGVYAENELHDGLSMSADEQFARTQFTNNNYTGYESFVNDRAPSVKAKAGANATEVVWSGNVWLRIGQVTSGTKADLTKCFSYELLLPEGLDSVSGKIGDTERTFTAADNAFALKNGESLLLENIPAGTELVVYENDPAVSTTMPVGEGDAGYSCVVTRTTSASTATVATDAADVRKVTITVLQGSADNPASVTFTNTLPAVDIPFTGIDDNTATWGSIVGAVLLGYVAMWLNRRRRGVARRAA